LRFPRPPAGRRRPRLQRRPVGHAVKPVGDPLPRPNRRRLADQDEERRLEGVLGVVVIPEDAPAHAPDHRAVPPHQRFEGRPRAAADEALQQLPVGEGSFFAAQQGLAQLRDQSIQGAIGHDSLGVSAACPLPLYCHRPGILIHIFLWTGPTARSPANGGPLPQPPRPGYSRQRTRCYPTKQIRPLRRPGRPRDCHKPMSKSHPDPALPTLTPDGRLLFVTRCVRLFAYGFLSVVLLLYLRELGLTEGQVGVLLTLILLGDTAISLWITTAADRLRPPRALLAGSVLMALAGVAFALTDNFWLLLLAGTVGVISPSGNEVGPFLAVEHAALAQTIPAERRTVILAWHNLAGSLATALGSL